MSALAERKAEAKDNVSENSRVAWREGMVLLPQHFQQAERSLEVSQDLRFRATSALSWGLIDLEVDAAALDQGRVELTRCQAVLHDGLVIDIPRSDNPPPPAAFTLPTGSNSLAVHIGVPLLRRDVPEVSTDPARGDVRYIARMVDRPDVNDPSRRQHIEVLTKNLKVIVGDDGLDGMSILKIAEIHRDTDGRAALLPTFIPSCMRIGASPRLMSVGRDLLGLVAARASSLASERQKRGTNTMELEATDIQSFWFLHTLNLHVTPLRQLMELSGTHPLDLYLELARLAGSLSTFALEEVTELPSYRHEAISESFAGVDNRIRELLAVLFTTNYEIIPLSKQGAFWTGHIADRELADRGRFFLSVTSGLPPAEIVGKLPQVFKMTVPDGIERLVRMAVGGVTISHMAKPPTGVPARGDSVYFRVNTEGEDWDRISRGGQLAAYVPRYLPGVTLQLIAMRRENG